MAEEFDIAKVNHYLELANYPYYDEGNSESFGIFMSSFEYDGNPDINLKTAYIYSIFVNMISTFATGYPAPILHELAYPEFVSNAGKSLKQKSGVEL